jgi:hypothetical protein
MDQAGIDRAILSMSSPGVHFGNDAAARVLAREVNEAGAWISQQYPDRFGQFAALPLPDADGALVEIAYALDDLGADGVILLSNSGGRYLGDSHLSPVLAELDQRRAVILLHPTSCVGHEHVSCGRPRPMIEFLFDTARTVVDFILSGAAERFPNLQLIVPHAGGVLPLLADRVELFRTLDGDTDDRKPVTSRPGSSTTRTLPPRGSPDRFSPSTVVLNSPDPQRIRTNCACSYLSVTAPSCHPRRMSALSVCRGPNPGILCHKPPRCALCAMPRRVARVLRPDPQQR